MSSTFTLEFGHEYEKERGRWLRRRFLWYSGVTIGLNTVVVLISAIALSVMLTYGGNGKTAPVQQGSVTTQAPTATADSVEPDAGSVPATVDAPTGTPNESESQESRTVTMSRRALITQQVVTIPAVILGTGLYLSAFLRVRKRPMDRDQLLSLVTRLIIYSGSIGIVAAIIGFEAIRWTDPVVYRQLREQTFAVSVGFNSLLGIMMTHFLASLFLPWTPRESLRPILPLAALTLVVTGFYSLDRLWMVPVALAMSLVIALPGLLVCWLRNSRFRSRFHFKMVSRRYSEIKDELDAARQIHDAMFPAPIDDGPVRMRYSYEPMRQIGGDYLFTHRVDTSDGEGRGLLVVLLDVTGHGITAALTVNRLQGEIERQVSMDRSVTPGTVLSGLNDYLHHTLARHSVYATALVMKVDPDAGTVVWASAGHPPGFLCTVDGTIHHLESTTIVLGATRGEHFQSVEEQIPFGRGDTVLAYTDGVIEAKNDQGRMLRIEGVEKFLAGHCRSGSQDEDLPKILLEYVHDFRSGPAEDDSLIVEVTRPV